VKLILDVSNSPLSAFTGYFLDANIWIELLAGSSGLQNQAKDDMAPYRAFVDGIMAAWDEVIERGKTGQSTPPKIIITPTILSETVNTYMRNIATAAYFRTHPSPKGKKNAFKQDYRGIDGYAQQLARLYHDIRAYERYISWEPDLFDKKMAVGILSNTAADADFNDYHYQLLVKKWPKVAIITHNKDFAHTIVRVLTANRKLLNP